jgi:hypothetical protein
VTAPSLLRLFKRALWWSEALKTAAKIGPLQFLDFD